MTYTCHSEPVLAGEGICLGDWQVVLPQCGTGLLVITGHRAVREPYADYFFSKDSSTTENIFTLVESILPTCGWSAIGYFKSEIINSYYNFIFTLHRCYSHPLFPLFLPEVFTSKNFKQSVYYNPYFTNDNSASEGWLIFSISNRSVMGEKELIRQEYFQRFIKRIFRILWAIIAIPINSEVQGPSARIDWVERFPL